MSLPGGKPISIKKLTVPCTIQSRTEIKDDRGGVSYGWVDVWPNVWCYIYSKPISALTAGGTVLSAWRHDVKCRWRDGIVQGMRIVNLRTHTHLYIQSIDDIDFKHDWLSMICVEADPDSSTGG
jgi:head-tail adaptor